MIILIDNYDSFTYNLYHYLSDLGVEAKVYRNDQITVAQVLAAKPEGIVLSPGPKTPNEAGICLELIKAAAPTVPLFGVCLGMQAIGQAFGGDVVRAPTLMHGKISKVDHYGTGIFKDIPNHFEATRYHSLVVNRDSLPDELEVTAETDGLIMGLRHKDYQVHGVQFHPESIASAHGHALLQNFITLARTR